MAATGGRVSDNDMRGIILAAGTGTRFNGAVHPKCLATFDGRSLINIQLSALRACGITDITVVVGFGAECVRRACGPHVRFIENTRFRETNSLYSLWLARRVLGQGFVVMNCDVLFHPAMLVDLLTAQHQNALLVAYPEFNDPEMGPEEMKVCVRKGLVVDIDKNLSLRRTDGENVGIAKFSADGAGRLIAAMRELVEAEQLSAWAPRAFRRFAQDHPLYAVGTRGLPWTEIDTPEDYRHGLEHVYPAIRDAVARPARIAVGA
jgi:L-glutamine-phosphate cytidylyltransferase